MNKSDLENLSNFILHAKGNFIMISGYDDERNKHTFMATTPIVKYLLCDMNQKISICLVVNLVVYLWLLIILVVDMN